MAFETKKFGESHQEENQGENGSRDGRPGEFLPFGVILEEHQLVGAKDEEGAAGSRCNRRDGVLSSVLFSPPAAQERGRFAHDAHLFDPCRNPPSMLAFPTMMHGNGNGPERASFKCDVGTRKGIGWLTCNVHFFSSRFSFSLCFRRWPVRPPRKRSSKTVPLRIPTPFPKRGSGPPAW